MRAGADVISSNLPQVLTAGFLVFDWDSTNTPYAGAGSSSLADQQTSRKRPISDVDVPASTVTLSTVHADSSNPSSAQETTFSKTLTMRTPVVEDDEKGPSVTKDKVAVTARLKMKRSMYSTYCLDLADEKFSRDTGPLVVGCQCHACRYIMIHFRIFKIESKLCIELL